MVERDTGGKVNIKQAVNLVRFGAAIPEGSSAPFVLLQVSDAENVAFQ